MTRLVPAALALPLALALPASAKASPSPPATVVVAFDTEAIRPLIAEGVRNFESGDPVRPNDPVRIASISKLVMALAALRLADEGAVDLDADVSDYLGWQVRSAHHRASPVTLTHLLMHRAGLSDAAGYSIPLGESLEEKLADPAAWNEGAVPGEAAFEYANLGSAIVATVLEAASGERYDRLLDRLVFAPLGIEACINWTLCSQEMIARSVALYRNTGEPARDFPGDLPPDCSIPVAEGIECSLDDYVPGTNASVFSPQGGVRIGMIDLARLGRAILNDDTGPFARLMMMPAAKAMMLGGNEGQEFFCRYGLGMQLIETPLNDCEDELFADGSPRLGHPGEAYGLRSGLWFTISKPISGIAYFTTQVPPREGAEDEGGFSQIEKDLMGRAAALQAQDPAD